MIKNIKVETLGRDIVFPKALDKPENHALIPHYRRQLITIHLKNSSKAIANGLRRTLMDEMDIKAFDVDPADIETDDVNILAHAVIKSIQSIRINQKIPENVRFSLDFHNTSAEPVMISADQLKTTHKLNFVPFNTQFRIITVRDGRYLKIPNIKIKTAQGRIPGQSLHTAVCSIGYKPLDVEMYDRGVGQSSLNTNPKEYELTITTNGTVEPKWLLENACKSIYDRVIALQKEVELYDPKLGNHSSDLLDIYIANDIAHYVMKHETYTIGYLLNEFVYKCHPDISLSNLEIEHPTMIKSTYKICSTNHKKIVIEAFENITKTFKDLEAEFGDKLENKKKK